MNLLSGTNTLSYDNKSFSIPDMNKIMHQNLIFNTTDRSLWYNNYNRYGWLDIYNHDIPSREYIFITKPDLMICTGTMNYNVKLISSLANNSLFIHAINNHKDAILELQYRIKDNEGDINPFMRYLTNACISKMEIPAISAGSNQSTSNTNGSFISYRSTSLQSDNQFDFTLTFRDTAYLDIYTMVKCYDEYTRLLKAGFIDFASQNTKNASYSRINANYDINSYKYTYITNHIDPLQFSVYKFIVGADGETLLYWIKATGVVFTNVPRDEFGDPPSDGFKLPLAFHANFISDDMDPVVLGEFNTITLGSTDPEYFLPVVDSTGTNNEPAKYPVIHITSNDKRTYRHNKKFEYRLKWTNKKRSIVEDKNRDLAIKSLEQLSTVDRAIGSVYSTATSFWTNIKNAGSNTITRLFSSSSSNTKTNDSASKIEIQNRLAAATKTKGR